MTSRAIPENELDCTSSVLVAVSRFSLTHLLNDLLKRFCLSDSLKTKALKISG
jgi:hypothetical protein